MRDPQTGKSLYRRLRDSQAATGDKRLREKLKMQLKSKGLPKSYFTKKRTKARKKAFHEAIDEIKKIDPQAAYFARLIWG